ncbi:hypothetical protein MSAN_02037900 [Mycena sanguinolenta]|uniref:Uncharacterized protein n=1 Tax=Mycena sanguinolenta TaxID=230812 RepID=A0A8H6XJV7_9AGAR|nr:hypothetical protein MSAN_02037900 [Mycena sanguinolenta]
MNTGEAIVPGGSAEVAHPTTGKENRVTLTLVVMIAGMKQNVFIIFDVLRTECYEDYDEQRIETLYRDFIVSISPELTHNAEPFQCLECGRSATDITWVSFYTASRPLSKRCVLVISAVCAECGPEMQETMPRFAQLEKQCSDREGDSVPDSVIGTIPRPAAMSVGLSAACLNCHKEHNVTPNFRMSRWGKCKLVSYVSLWLVSHTDHESAPTGIAGAVSGSFEWCTDGLTIVSVTSAECQKEDWARHKKICGIIRQVYRDEVDRFR